MSERVIVVGAGVLGAALADMLAEAGHPVVLLDPTPGGQASPGSLAWLNASFAEDPVYNALRHDSLLLWDALRASDAPPPVRRPGAILWEQEHFDLDAILSAQQALGRPARMLDRAEHLALEPALPDPPARSVLLEHDGFGWPVEVTRWFLDRALARGAELRQERVDAIATLGGRVSGVRTGAGAIEADHVVLATGIDQNGLLASLGLGIAMDNRPGLLVTTTPTKPLIERMLATDGLHGWQGRDGRFLIGASFGGDGADGDAEDLARGLVARLAERIPATAGATVERQTVRVRPMPADGRPAVGRVGPEGLWMVSTHSGMTLAPVLAEVLAREIAGGTDPRLDPYRPDRAALEPEPA